MSMKNDIKMNQFLKARVVSLSLVEKQRSILFLQMGNYV